MDGYFDTNINCLDGLSISISSQSQFYARRTLKYLQHVRSTNYRGTCEIRTFAAVVASAERLRISTCPTFPTQPPQDNYLKRASI